MSTAFSELPPMLRERLAEIARETGRAETLLIVEAVEEYVSRHRRPMPTSIGIVDDPEFTADKIDDWLREHWRPA